MTATLYGVGPGAPDLITLRAIDTIKRVPVLALPRGSDYGASKAWGIVKPTLGEIAGQKRLFLTFPMSKEPERLLPAWARAFAQPASTSFRAATSPSSPRAIPLSTAPSSIYRKRPDRAGRKCASR